MAEPLLSRMASKGPRKSVSSNKEKINVKQNQQTNKLKSTPSPQKSVTTNKGGPQGKKKESKGNASNLSLPLKSSSSTSIKSVAISEERKYIKYDDPIFGQLKYNRNTTNSCACLSCHGQCFLSDWCKVIACVEIVVTTTGMIVAISMLSLEEETKSSICLQSASTVRLFPTTVDALDQTFIVCLATYCLMFFGSVALLVAAIAISEDEHHTTLLYHDVGWMNITFFKTCCWVFPFTTLVCTLGQIWSFLLNLHHGFIITFGFILELYFSVCSMGLFTQIRISTVSKSFDRVDSRSKSTPQLKRHSNALKTRST